jgi:hypothetical protein
MESAEDAMRLMNGWLTVLGGHMVTEGIALSSEVELKKLKRYVTEGYEKVTRTLSALRGALNDEHLLLWRPSR